MAFPTPPAVTNPFPSRNIQDRNTFDAQVADFGARYLPEREAYEIEYAQEAESLAAALVAGNLPDLSGHGGTVIGVRGDQSSVGFARPGNIIATYGGTANAITLATGLGLPEAPELVKFRFLATAANTGAATVTIDGTTYPAETVSGAVLPAGYIRTGVVTECYRLGSAIIVDRQTETVTNANGTATMHADGRLTGYIKNFALSTLSGGNTVASGSWMFPVASKITPKVLVGSQGANGSSVASNAIGAPFLVSRTINGANLSIRTLAGQPAFSNGDAPLCDVEYEGTWI